MKTRVAVFLGAAVLSLSACTTDTPPAPAPQTPASTEPTSNERSFEECRIEHGILLRELARTGVTTPSVTEKLDALGCGEDYRSELTRRAGR